MRHHRRDLARIQDPSNLIPRQEPVLLLRGDDPCAPGALEAYADALEQEDADPQLVEAVRCWADEMRGWQRHPQGRCQLPTWPPDLSPPSYLFRDYAVDDEGDDSPPVGRPSAGAGKSGSEEPATWHELAEGQRITVCSHEGIFFFPGHRSARAALAALRRLYAGDGNVPTQGELPPSSGELAQQLTELTPANVRQGFWIEAATEPEGDEAPVVTFQEVEGSVEGAFAVTWIV